MPGWPWLAVVYWPPASATGARDHGIAMARGCYTLELFDRPEQLDDHCSTLIESLSSQAAIKLRLLSADQMDGGRA